jgi:hypothetical protein
MRADHELFAFPVASAERPMVAKTFGSIVINETV